MAATSPVSNAAAAAVPAGSAAAKQAAASSSGGIPSSFSSLTEMKNRAPQVYNMMMQTLAQSICSNMKQQSDTLTQMIREGENNS